MLVVRVESPLVIVGVDVVVVDIIVVVLSLVGCGHPHHQLALLAVLVHPQR